MSRFELITFASNGELCQRAAEEWLSVIETSLRTAAPFHVALSGGRIAGRFFVSAADLFKARRTNLDSVHFFWSDERCVPPRDPESNFRLADELLLEPLGIPASQIHRIRGEHPPAEAAAEAQAEICRLAPTDKNGQPVLDLIFLGLGEDGHVASLFPGEAEELARSSAVYRPVTAVKPPPHRITLDYAAIAAARHVWVLVSGAGKEKALIESLAPPGRTPLSRVLALRKETKIFTDMRL